MSNENNTDDEVGHMDRDDIDMVIYHNPCADGTGSAYSAWKYLSNKYPEREVTYFPTNHGKPPPDVTGKNVLICDFSYKKNYLNDMIKSANNLLIIDHHKTAVKELEDIPDKYKIFDMDHSGAMLTWEYFYPTEPAPLMISYIQDRDIWTNKLPYVNEYASWFFTLPHEFEEYDKYFDDKVFQQMLETKGVGMVEKDKHNINQVSPFASVKFQKIGDTYLFIVYLNTTILKSEVGNVIITENKYADFSVVYNINDYNDTTSFSFRSTNKNYDASKIASYLGGGGHRNACGSKVSYVTNSLPATTLDNGKLYKNLEKVYFNAMVIGDMDINVAYLSADILKHELGCYLLQDKYNDGKNDIQECVAIYRERDNKPNFYDRAQVAALWSYDRNKDETYFKLTFDNKLTSDCVDELMRTFGTDKFGQLTYSGFTSYIIPATKLP